MVKVDLHLSRAVLMNQSIKLQLLVVGKIIHVLDEVFELCNRIDAKGQPSDFPAP